MTNRAKMVAIELDKVYRKKLGNWPYKKRPVPPQKLAEPVNRIIIDLRISKEE